MAAADPSPVVGPELRPLTAAELPRDLLDGHPELQTLGSRIPLRTYLRDMWLQREFAATVPLSQLEASNQDTVLGRFWNILNPLLLIAIYYLIFQMILGIESRRGVEAYLPFLTVGVISYNFTRASMHGGALAVVKNRSLVQTLYFPRALLPLSAIIAKAVSHLYAVGVMVVMLLIFGVRPAWTWLLLPVVLLVHTVMNLGLALFVARFTFHFRDFEKLLTYVLRLLLYMSGVLIPINDEIIPNVWLLRMLELNPVYAIIEMTREALLSTPMTPMLWAYGSACAFVLLVVGFAYYRRAEHEYARV